MGVIPVFHTFGAGVAITIIHFKIRQVMGTYRNKKVIFFCDMMGDIEEDLKYQVEYPLLSEGIEFDKIETTTTPPFDSYFDVLFFDWGGMSLGNSMLEHFCKHIMKMAHEQPSRYFVMVSTFTSAAMKEALDYMDSDEKLPNIYLTVKDFAKDFKAVNK